MFCLRSFNCRFPVFQDTFSILGPYLCSYVVTLGSVPVPYDRALGAIAPKVVYTRRRMHLATRPSSFLKQSPEKDPALSTDTSGLRLRCC